jgi:hypothetical protein
MEVVSTAFNEAKLSNVRETKALVEFIINNTSYPSGSSVAVSGNANISNADEVVQAIRQEDLIASLENDRFALDGSYFLPEQNDFYSWWSDELADEDGLFTSNPTLTITLGSGVSLTKATILWGQGEVPLEFIASVNGIPTTYTNGESIIDVDTIMTSLEIEVVKVEPYRRAKIQCIDLGITKIYDDNNIIDLELTEQFDPMSITLPSNSLNVKVENFDGDFDILNPNSLYSFITPQAPVNVKMGHITQDGVEYIEMGRFLLDELKQGTNEVILSATDQMAKLDEVLFYGWESDPASPWVSGSYTIKGVIDYLMGQVGITNYTYNFDDILDITTPDMNFGWYSLDGIKTARDLLKRIALYYNLSIWVNRQGQIVFDYVRDYANNLFTYFNFGRTSEGGLPNSPTGNSITIEDCKDFPKVEEQERLYAINYKSDFYAGWTATSRQVIVEDQTYTVSGTSTITLYLQKMATPSAYFVSAPIVTGTAAWSRIVVYDYKIEVDVSGSGTIKFEIDDVVFDTVSRYDRYAINPFVNYGYVLDLKMARFSVRVQLEPEGKPFEAIFVNDFKYRLKYTYDWRQDLTNNLGDIVLIEDKYNTSSNYMLITEQIYRYNGSLKGITVGLGAGVGVG